MSFCETYIKNSGGQTNSSCMFMFAIASSDVMCASTPFVLTAFSATVTLISLKSCSTAEPLNSFATASEWLFSTIILTSSVPVVIRIVGSVIAHSFANAWFGAMFIVMHAMLFFVLTTESLNMCCSIFSSSW